MSFKQILAGSLVAAWSVCAALHAQEVDATINDSIQEVIVTGMRPVYHVSSPAPVQMLRGRTLERLNSHSVADAVRYFAGIQLKDYGGVGGLKTVDIRSMGSAHAGIFYDGVQLGNAQNGQIDLGRFSLDNIETVSIYNGQKADILQSAKDYASAGTIYLTAVQPSFAAGQRTKLKAGYRTAFYQLLNALPSYGLTNPTLLWQQKLGRQTSSTLSAEWLNSNGRYRFHDRLYNSDGTVAYDTAAIRENSDVHAFRAEFGLNGAVQGGGWNVRAYFYSSERGLPGPTVRNVYYRDQRLWDRNVFIQGSFHQKIGRRYSFRTAAKYAHDYTHYVDKDEASLPVDNTYRQQELYISAVSKYDILTGWSIALPVDLQYNQLDANIHQFPHPQRYSAMAAFASALSYDRFKLQASILATTIHDVLKASAVAPPTRHKWSPAVFASFRPFSREDFHLRAFYKKTFRMPTFNDLYYTLAGVSFLRPESAAQWDAGITCAKAFQHAVFRSITFQADGYYSQVTDKIIAIPTSKFFRWEMTNLGRVETTGIDAAIHTAYRFCNIFLKNSISYTWQHALDCTNPSLPNYRHQIPYTPRHSGSFVLNAEYRGWGINYSFIYTGERYSSRENIRRNHIQPWYTSDVSISWEWMPRNIKYRLSAEINNLFNQYYAVIENYPMPGRNLKLAFVVDL